MNQKDKISTYQSKFEEILPYYIDLYFYKNKEATEFWNRLKMSNHCFIFGGFIVDFLKKKRTHRDIDIVVENLNEETLILLSKYNAIQNSFGGYKLQFGEINVDLWAIKDTWAIRKMNFLDFDLSAILPSTSFFNSTAVVFSVHNNKLFFKNSFLSYINNGLLDIIFEENPYPELCIIKTYENFLSGAQLSNNLSNYILTKFPSSYDKLIIAQNKHYGIVKYSLIDLYNFFEGLVNEKKIQKTIQKKDLKGQLALF